MKSELKSEIFARHKASFWIDIILILIKSILYFKILFGNSFFYNESNDLEIACLSQCSQSE